MCMLLWSDPHGPEVVGGAGVTYYPRPPHLSVVLPSVDGAVITTFSKVLLPLCLYSIYSLCLVLLPSGYVRVMQLLKMLNTI